jgi:integrase
MLPTPLHQDQLVFAGEAGGILNLHSWRGKTWKRALERAGVPYREPYGMRDSYATLNLADGAPLEWISEQMGHAEIDTTRRHYARWKEEREYAILDSLNAARSQTGQKADTSEAQAE